MSDTQDASTQAEHLPASPADTTSTTTQGPELREVKDLPDWAQKLIRETRKEAADHRTKLQRFEDRDKTAQQKAEEAATKAAAERDAAFKELQAERAERLVSAAAAKVNAIRPDAVFRLVRDAIEYGDDGRPTNIDQVVSAAKKDFPELFRAATGSADGGAGGNQPGTERDMNAMIRRAAGHSRP